MTNLSKALLITALFLVVLIILGGFWMIFRVYSTQTLQEFPLVENTYPADLSGIETELPVSDIHIFQTDGDKITLSYRDVKPNYYIVSTEGNVLSITRKSTISIMDIGLLANALEVNIGIPASFDGTLNIGTSTGGITVSGLALSKNLAFHSSTGSLSVSSLITDGAVSLETTTGSLKANGIQAKSLSVKATTGSVRVASCKGAERLTASAKTGSVAVENAQGGVCLFETTTGSVHLTALEVGTSLEVSASTGSINAELVNREEEFTIRSHTSTGSNTLPEDFGSGEKSLRATTSTGSIRFSFGK